MKPPGKRNYKHLFANLQKVCADEVSKASLMFKDMKGVYYKLINAERKIRRALLEKGLFLDDKDFDIMAIFNQELSDSYFDSDSEQNDIDSEKHFRKIYVNEFDDTPEKEKLKTEKRAKYEADRHSLESNLNQDENLLAKPALPMPSISMSKGSSPKSNSFEYKSFVSKLTHKSNLSFRSKNSRRLLFDEYRPEKRPVFIPIINPQKDFIWTCNRRNKLEYYPFALMEHQSKLRSWLESSESHSVLEGSELMRSISMPVPNVNEIEEKLLPPLSLERQPFSSILNYNRAQNHYSNPLEKVEIKTSTKVDNKFLNSFNPPQINERNFAEMWSSLGIEDHENIPI